MENKNLLILADAVDQLNEALAEQDSEGLAFSVEWFSYGWLIRFGQEILIVSEDFDGQVDDPEKPFVKVLKETFNKHILRILSFKFYYGDGTEQT